jgi:hypothetical protein
MNEQIVDGYWMFEGPRRRHLLCLSVFDRSGADPPMNPPLILIPKTHCGEARDILRSEPARILWGDRATMTCKTCRSRTAESFSVQMRTDLLSALWGARELPELEQFRSALFRDRDITVAGVAADWLEDRGHPLAELLRIILGRKSLPDYLLSLRR